MEKRFAYGRKVTSRVAIFAKPETTFEELYLHINKFITANGYINLDFMGNLGHSIENAKRR